MDGNTLTGIGLLINIAGVLILFKYGFPQPSFDEASAAGLLLEDNNKLDNGLTVKENREKQIKDHKKYKTLAYAALSLILVGFILQFIATTNMVVNS